MKKGIPLVKKWRNYILGMVPFFIFSFVIPLFIKNSFLIHMFIMSLINAILAIGLNFILGFIGEKSLGHAAFYGIGAYVTAILSTKFGIADERTMLFSIIFALIGALIIGIPSLRLRGPYFSIVTLGFALILQLLVANGGNFTGGPTGLPGVKRLEFYVPIFNNKIIFSTDISYYYLAIIIFWLCFFTSIFLTDSKVGRAWIAIRENLDLAESIGINSFKYKLIAFLVGASMAGIAGSIYAHYFSFVSPKVFDTSVNVNIVTMVIIGGEGTILGPIVGAFLITFLPEILRFTEEFRIFIFGFILLFTILFAPKGVTGLLVKFFKSKKEYKLKGA